MDWVSALAGGLIGLAAPFVVGFILSKVDPNRFAKWVSNVLKKVINDPKARNKIENMLGDELIELGEALKQVTPDSESN